MASKKVTVDKINYDVFEENNGLTFYPRTKDDAIKMHRLGQNGVVDSVMDMLNIKFGRNRFYYKAGKHIDEGLHFKYNTESILDRL